MTAEKKKIALVTGGNRGLGFETCRQLAQLGISVILSARDISKGEKAAKQLSDRGLDVVFYQLDVSNQSRINSISEQLMQQFTRLDVLVNNAGYGLLGALEELSMNNIQAQFETNFFGAIRCIKEIIPVMRQQRSGIIVNISSQAGYIGFPVCSVYDSTKFALEGLIESMTYEVEPYGIKMVLIEPGCINSDFLNRLVISNNTQDPKSPYFDMFKKFTANYFKAMNNAPPPEAVAKVILEAITSTNPLLRYQIGEDAKKFFKAKKEMTDENIHKLMAEAVLKA